MKQNPKDRRQLTQIWRGVIEVTFIVFLFYSNLLMGEFTASNGQGKSLAFALSDIVTGTIFLIAIISALVGGCLNTFEKSYKPVGSERSGANFVMTGRL